MNLIFFQSVAIGLSSMTEEDLMKNVFSTRAGIIVVGALIGVGAALLQFFGNPPNMGICVACFERDIAGALGLHRADVVQYLRPEIMGFVLGAFVAALMAGEYKPRGGSAPRLPRWNRVLPDVPCHS